MQKLKLPNATFKELDNSDRITILPGVINIVPGPVEFESSEFVTPGVFLTATGKVFCVMYTQLNRIGSLVPANFRYTSIHDMRQTLLKLYPDIQEDDMYVTVVFFHTDAVSEN